MNRVKAVMLLLIANEAPLGPERRDHALTGSWAGYRECHVGGDFLLIYRLDDADGPSGSIYFARVGTHADLFE
jgi:mRNA interferase YafQ